MTANTYDFAGKTVIVTGGGTGIGRAIVQAFGANGANVVAAGRRKAPLDDALAGIPEPRRLAVPADVSDPFQARELVRAAVDQFGAVDIVVPNAAIFLGGSFHEQDLSDWEQIRSVNTDGFVHTVHAALPELLRTKGNVVAISSVSGLRGDWGQAMYNATKAAVTNFVQSLALEYGDRGVRFNSVAPAATATEMNTDAAKPHEEIAAMIDRVALGRMGQPEDIAPAVLFLASADAGYITGANLAVDGGTSASTGQAHPA